MYAPENVSGLESVRNATSSSTGKMSEMQVTTVVPKKSDSDVIICLQL